MSKSILEILSENRIFCIEKYKGDEKFYIGECCDYYFTYPLTKDELKQLGQELIELSEKG